MDRIEVEASGREWEVGTDEEDYRPRLRGAHQCRGRGQVKGIIGQADVDVWVQIVGCEGSGHRFVVTVGARGRVSLRRWSQSGCVG